jgi:hypothetical protein
MNFLNDAAQSDDLYATAWGKLRDAHAEGQAPATVAIAATEYLPLVSTRIAALHEALRGLGLPAAELSENSVRLVGMTDKAVQLAFRDVRNQEVSLDLAWNGNAFLAGRRYESSLSRVSLSDAEIARTAILRIDIDRVKSVIAVTFLSPDGRDARILIDVTQPFAPTVEGKVPEMSRSILKMHASLTDLCRPAIGSAERAGAQKGFFSRLLDSKASQARSDARVLSAFLAENRDSEAERAAWAQHPHLLRTVGEAIIRRLSDDPTQAPLLIRGLVVIAIGQILALNDDTN